MMEAGRRSMVARGWGWREEGTGGAQGGLRDDVTLSDAKILAMCC